MLIVVCLVVIAIILYQLKVSVDNQTRLKARVQLQEDARALLVAANEQAKAKVRQYANAAGLSLSDPCVVNALAVCDEQASDLVLARMLSVLDRPEQFADVAKAEAALKASCDEADREIVWQQALDEKLTVVRTLGASIRQHQNSAAHDQALGIGLAPLADHILNPFCELNADPSEQFYALVDYTVRGILPKILACVGDEPKADHFHGRHISGPAMLDTVRKELPAAPDHWSSDGVKGVLGLVSKIVWVNGSPREAAVYLGLLLAELSKMLDPNRWTGAVKLAVQALINPRPLVRPHTGAVDQASKVATKSPDEEGLSGKREPCADKPTGVARELAHVGRSLIALADKCLSDLTRNDPAHHVWEALQYLAADLTGKALTGDPAKQLATLNMLDLVLQNNEFIVELAVKNRLWTPFKEKELSEDDFQEMTSRACFLVSEIVTAAIDTWLKRESDQGAVSPSED